MYGWKIKPAACEHRIFGRMIHIQVLDSVCGTNPRRSDEKSDAQTVVYLWTYNTYYTQYNILRTYRENWYVFCKLFFNRPGNRFFFFKFPAARYL